MNFELIVEYLKKYSCNNNIVYTIFRKYFLGIGLKSIFYIQLFFVEDQNKILKIIYNHIESENSVMVEMIYFDSTDFF